MHLSANLVLLKDGGGIFRSVTNGYCPELNTWGASDGEYGKYKAISTIYFTFFQTHLRNIDRYSNEYLLDECGWENKNGVLQPPTYSKQQAIEITKKRLGYPSVRILEVVSLSLAINIDVSNNQNTD